MKEDDGQKKEYTEVGINGFAYDKLPLEFDKDGYRVLLVANKYQTGFDQPKLCALYILKRLKGVNAVQTLSRLNRICQPYDKKTFVLDFVNDYEDMKAAFSKYYTTTLLSNSVTPSAIYDIEAKIDGYAVIDPMDIDAVNDLLYKEDISAKFSEVGSLVTGSDFIFGLICSSFFFCIKFIAFILPSRLYPPPGCLILIYANRKETKLYFL